MIIQHQTWRRFTRMGSVLALPVVLFLFIRPDWGVWGHRFEIAAYIVLSLFCGTGALLAFLMRAGVVQFVYSEADKKTFEYKISKRLAEREQRGLGSRFSKRYFESYDIEKKDSKDSAA